MNTRMIEKELTENILSAINKTIEEFQKNPYTFLYESDLQAALFTSLRGNLSYNIQIPITNGGKYILNPVYTQYLDKIDIVCLDPITISQIPPESSNRYDTYIYSLPIFLGIELKYVYMGYKMGFDILFKDFEKLSTPAKQDIKGKIKHWLVLGFIQRDEEALPLIKNAHTYCEEIKETKAIDVLNGIYMITHDKIYLTRLKTKF